MTEIISACKSSYCCRYHHSENFPVFSLTEAKMDSLGPFVLSFFAAQRARGVVLNVERSRILQHWEDHFPHTFLTLIDFRKSPEDMAYVRRKKLEVHSISLIFTGPNEAFTENRTLPGLHRISSEG